MLDVAGFVRIIDKEAAMWLVFFLSAVAFVLIYLWSFIAESLKQDSEYWKNRKNMQ